MSISLTQIKPSAITLEHVGLYAEVTFADRCVRGGISDVHQSALILEVDGEPTRIPVTRLYLGGQQLPLDQDTPVQVAAPTDPCDGTPLTESEPAADLERPTTLEQSEPEPTETSTSKPHRARGHWVTVIGSTTLVGFGTSLALASEPLTGGTFAGMALIALGGAALVRVLHLAGAIR